MTADTTPESLTDLIGWLREPELARWPHHLTVDAIMRQAAAALSDAQTKLVEREAVITEATAAWNSLSDVSQVGRILSRPLWHEALTAHDAEVARKALLDAADDFERASAAGIEPALNRLASKLLRDRAERITPDAAVEPLPLEIFPGTRAALGALTVRAEQIGENRGGTEPSTAPPTCVNCHRELRMGRDSGRWFHLETQRYDCLRSEFDDAPYSVATPTEEN